jgi:DNA-binding winged helix-turn-helix (wHTH) protein
MVEFDPAINNAIRRLRDALGESAERPRYIETVARRGYRFLGEVEAVEAPASGPPASATAPGGKSTLTISRASPSPTIWCSTNWAEVEWVSFSGPKTSSSSET